MIDLNDYGISERQLDMLNEYIEPKLEAARVISEHKELYRIITSYGELNASITGKFRFNATTGEYPAVGDFVAVEARPNEGSATIHSVLPRKSVFSRKAAGNRTDEQIVAANFDYVFIMASLNLDLNIRRIERYLTLAWESGGLPVIVLTKADLCEDIQAIIKKTQAAAPGVDVHAISSISGIGLDALQKYTQKGKTIAFMGSSGIGKSTLVNCLAGQDIMLVNGIREDDSKGKHTTTYRQLIMLPSGCIIVDTPGMRELSMWDGEEGIATAFNDIEELSKLCKFNDCRHGNEPGCMVRKAIDDGTLESSRLDSYRKLQKEILFMESKRNQSIAKLEKDKSKKISKLIKANKKGM